MCVSECLQKVGSGGFLYDSWLNHVWLSYPKHFSTDPSGRHEKTHSIFARCYPLLDTLKKRHMRPGSWGMSWQPRIIKYPYLKKQTVNSNVNQSNCIFLLKYRNLTCTTQSLRLVSKVTVAIHSLYTSPLLCNAGRSYEDINSCCDQGNH